MTIDDLDDFIEAYAECALWSSTDEDDDNLDANYSTDDLAPDTLERFRRDCLAFVVANRTDLADLDPSQAGHDFWLTRNGHGVGFWDRGLGELGERLSSASRKFKEAWLYVGDDGLIHCM
jgi:hypothetical protein